MWGFSVALAFVVLAIVQITGWIWRWRHPICNGKLPPGSMGLPIIGETLQFFKTQYSFDIPPFVKKRMEKYGPLFKTSLIGWPVIVSTDPEICHFIIQQEGKSVELCYLEAFAKLIGNQSLAKSTGPVYKSLKNSILNHFGPEKQKGTLVSNIEDTVRTKLHVWSKQESIEVKEAATTMTFSLGSRLLLSYDPSKSSDNLRDMFSRMFEALISVPLNIPGTAFYKCLKDQKKALRVIKSIIKERLDDSTVKHGDFLDFMIEEMKKDEPLFNTENASYFLFGLLFASFETVSVSLTLAIKFLSENPSVLQDLTNEHEEILGRREIKDSPLTWNEYKSMTFTSHVIDETLRLANITPVILRKVLRDINVAGYTIPAGWTFMVSPPAIHLNPEKYKDPLLFNPSRWKGQGSNIASKKFVAFGGGMRLCAGAEFAKLELAVILHFLVTKYRWTKIKGGEVAKNPGISFPNGLHIKVTEIY